MDFNHNCEYYSNTHDTITIYKRKYTRDYVTKEP